MSQPTVPQIEAPPQVPEEVLDDYLKAQILSLSSIVTKVIDLSDLATRNIPKPTSPPPQQQQQQQQSHAQQQDHKKKHFLSKNPFHHKNKDSQPISSPPPSLIKDDLIFTELIGKLEKLAKTGNIPGITISIQTRYGLINYYNTNKNYIKFEINPENFIELFNLFKLLPSLIELYSSNDLENYYIQLIEFIDLLLSCNMTLNQRKTLLNLRRNIMSLEFQAIGEFDSNFTKNLSKIFNYNENDLLKKLNFLKNDINKNYEYEFLFITKGITSFYTERDFDNLKSFQKWESISNKLFNDLLNAYKSSIGITNTNDYKKIIPKNYSTTRDYLIELLLTSNSQFLFNGLTNCFKLWQIDPFQLQCDFLNKGYQIMSNNNFEIFDFTFALKIISLSMAISPVQLDLRDWPMGKRTEYFNALGKFHKNSQSTFEKVYEIFIDDPKSFSIASDFLEKLYPFGVPTKLLNDIHLKLSEIAESSLQNEFNKINDSVLHPSKNANPIQEFSTTIAKILVNAKNVDEIIDDYYIDKYNIKEILINNYLITAFKNSHKIIDKIHKNKNLNISNPKESNVLVILDTLNLLKIETLELSSSSSSQINEENFDEFIGFDIQEILYKDLLNLVINLKSELENQVENSIKIDTLDRLPNVSYSSSVQNVFGLCDAYLKQIDNLNWKLQIQNGILKTYIFKFITSSLIYYCEIMSKRIYKELLSLNNNAYNGDMANFIAETCLNNIFQVLNLISKYQNQDTENISKLLNSDPQLVAKYTSGRKLVSIDILNCENIEDKKGNPLNMFVEILGPINGKTRTINRDYNPQWNESFDSVVNKNSSNLNINVKFDEKKLDTQPQIYKSIR
ncbi:unnamed protein product [[Candida] boidinii]|uniref:Unnamed protein product n=1 Tax=Candida boidinii TaxID=5477 RepID=A0A9W6WHQ1_CANBO|nr:unnamed protein product [[Candida] boidinii]